MTSCKDCIHCSVCGARIVADENYPERHYTENNKCSTFKDRSKFVELPCKVGDMVYTVHSDEDGAFIEEPIVVEVSTHRIWIENYFFDYDDIGKTVFLTREEAEQALRERENNV